MQAEYDFSKGTRGAILRPAAGKTRITIRIDDDVLEWFRAQVRAAGGGSYQTLINTALRVYVESQATPRMQEREDLAEAIRPVLREELARYVVTPTSADPDS